MQHKSKPDGRTFADGVAQMNRESGGLLRVEIIRDPESVLAILIPASDNASTAIASAICDRCSAADDAALISRASAAYEAVFPSLRCIEVTHPQGGRA